MGILDKAWKITKDLSQKAVIAYSSYQIGDANNDSEKVSNALIQVAQEKYKNIHENETESDNKYAIIALIIFAIIIAIIFIALSVRYITARAIKKDRRIRNNIQNVAQNA